MKTWLINLLFRLLGQTHEPLYNIQYLFGASTQSQAARKKRWERALARLWKDKDLLDYLYYQAESDKEKVFQGKIRQDLSRGARIRTLFLVYSARRAYEEQFRKKGNLTATQRGEQEEATKEVQKIYKDLVDIG